MLEAMGIEAGEMQLKVGGKMTPCKGIVDAYQRYVKDYKKENGISSVEALEFHIEDCINGDYAPLAGNGEIEEDRREFMRRRIELLVATVGAKNAQEFSEEALETYGT